MLVPGSNESRLAHARNSASWTRSSARSTLPDNEMANARRLGTAASIASRTCLRGLILGPLIVRTIEAAQNFDKAVGHALIDDLPIHDAELLADLRLDVGTELCHGLQTLVVKIKWLHLVVKIKWLLLPRWPASVHLLPSQPLAGSHIS